MLASLTVRDIVLIERAELHFAPGLNVLTGETGAGKSILLDALALLLGDRFELRQLKAGADRAELAAEFDIEDRPDLHDWLSEQGLAGSASDEANGPLLLRRSLDAQGKSHPVAWRNGQVIDLLPTDDAGNPWSAATAEGVSQKNSIIGWGVPAGSAVHCLVWTPK